MNRPSDIATELSLLEGSLSSIRQELVQADLYKDGEWTKGFADHIIKRLGNVENLLNEAKGKIAQEKMLVSDDSGATHEGR